MAMISRKRTDSIDSIAKSNRRAGERLLARRFAFCQEAAGQNGTNPLEDKWTRKVQSAERRAGGIAKKQLTNRPVGAQGADGVGGQEARAARGGTNP